jgi:protein-arginine kinase activator protein McsA
VHYRDSKLTHLLKDSLGGNSKTSVIGTVTDDCEYSNENIWTLKFVNRVKMVKNKAFINEENAENVEILRDEIKKLKQELASATAALITTNSRGSSTRNLQTINAEL